MRPVVTMSVTSRLGMEMQIGCWVAKYMYEGGEGALGGQRFRGSKVTINGGIVRGIDGACGGAYRYRA